MIRSTTPLDPLTLPRHPGWGLWGAWVGATTLAATLGLVLADLPVIGTPASELHGDSALPALVVWGCGSVPALGISIGLAQGAVLWGRQRSRQWILWIVASVLGVFLAELALLLCGVSTGGNGAGCGWVVLPGFLFGAAQLWILSPRRPGVALWVLANGAGWVLAVASGTLVWNMFYRDGFDSARIGGFLFAPWNYALAWATCWLVGALIFGAITGGALIVILRQPLVAPARHKTAPLEPLDL